MKPLTDETIAALIKMTETLTTRQIEWLSVVGIRKELTGKASEQQIAAIERVYDAVCFGRYAAERVGLREPS